MNVESEKLRIARAICNQLNVALESELGAGAFKNAYLVSYEQDRYALKIAPVSESLRPRFEREVQALKDCSHPSIAVLRYAKAHAVEDKSYWVIVEEYLAHGTLEDRLKNGNLPREAVLNMGIALASAIAHLHEKKLVHRDIKPANILFRTPADAVLTDFGIVRTLSEPSLTHDFIMQGPGTPLYAAPEQLLNEKAAIDWRTDQFGLSLVLVKSLTGHHAFAPANGGPQEAVSAVSQRADLPMHVSEQLHALGLECLVKALKPWPVQRYRYPKDFLDALNGAS